MALGPWTALGERLLNFNYSRIGKSFCLLDRVRAVLSVPRGIKSWIPGLVSRWIKAVSTIWSNKTVPSHPLSLPWSKFPHDCSKIQNRPTQTEENTYTSAELLRLARQAMAGPPGSTATEPPEVSTPEEMAHLLQYVLYPDSRHSQQQNRPEHCSFELDLKFDPALAISVCSDEWRRWRTVAARVPCSLQHSPNIFRPEPRGLGASS
jgi:hypothetical protein